MPDIPSLTERKSVSQMNNLDLDIAAGSSAMEQLPAACPPTTRQYPPGLSRPTDPLRINIVTAFCTCDIDAPRPSYLPRLPSGIGKSAGW